MNQAVPVNHTNGPPRDKPPYIQNGVNNFIELSDSESEGYEDAFHVPEVPAHSPHLDLPHHQLGGYFGANNQIFDLENDNLMYQPRSPQPAVAAAPENNAMTRNLPPVKDEEGEINWTQWMDEENDEGINRVLLEDYTLQAEYNRASHSFVDPSRLDQSFQPPENTSYPPMMETKSECINAVVVVFPEICRDYVAGLYERVSFNPDLLVAHILDEVDTGTPYPKAKDVQKQLKRKRVLTEEEEAIQKYEAAGRVVGPGLFLERTLVRSILSFEFPVIPLTFIDETLRSTGHRLFSAYRTLEEADRTFDASNPPYRRIKTPRKMPHEYRDGRIELSIQNNESPEKTETLKELLVCRKIRKTAESRRLTEQEAVLAEEENLKKAEAEGTMTECCCCYSDYPLNRMVHCNNEEVLHWFCRGCARQAAETEIGNSKYLLMCMSTDGCEAGFSLEQRNQFLDESTIVALERNEAEAVLRMAGIENLASCPFCPFAAEYPPVEINREFRCQAPDCEKVSCRLCKLESHIPMTCAENAKENGLSIRRQIEEAMSAAMIRTCNKCSTPFVKEEGCNKMTCTRNGCRNVQCYVCSKSCNYDHFNDVRRGGKEGNCPLFESVEERHNDEVRKAEKEALDRVRAEHPEYSEEDLRVKMSVNVAKDDERRKATDPVARNPYVLYRPGAMGQEQDAWPRDHGLELARLRRGGFEFGLRYMLGDGDRDGDGENNGGNIARPDPLLLNADVDVDAERERARNQDREREREAVRQLLLDHYHFQYVLENGIENGNENENIALPDAIQLNADADADADADGNKNGNGAVDVERERNRDRDRERERDAREAAQQFYERHLYRYRLQHPLGDANGDADVVAVAERERNRNGEKEAREFAQRFYDRYRYQLGLRGGDENGDGNGNGNIPHPDPIPLNAGGNEYAAALAAANVVAERERERVRNQDREREREREREAQGLLRQIRDRHLQYADGNGSGNEQEINNYPNFLPPPIPRPQPQLLFAGPERNIRDEGEVRGIVRNSSPPRLARDHNQFMGNRENLGLDERAWKRFERLNAHVGLNAGPGLKAGDGVGMYANGGEDFNFHPHPHPNVGVNAREKLRNLKRKREGKRERERDVIDGIPMPEEDVFSDEGGGEGERRGREK